MRNYYIKLCFIIIVILISGCSTSSSTETTSASNSSEVPPAYISDGGQQAIQSGTVSPSLSTHNEKNYSDDEILSFVLKYSGLNETTIKLEDWPEINEDDEPLDNPIFFVVVEARPDINSKEVDERDYYRVYFGQNYGDHTARYLWIYVKKDLSEIVLAEDLFEGKVEVIHPENNK